MNTIEQSKVKKADIWKVPFSMIEIEPGLNIREDMGDIPSLAESIRKNGVLVAMRGYRKGENFTPVDGHRRYAACALLAGQGIDIIIPFIIETKGTNIEQRVIDMFVTNDGKQLTPLEMAEGVKRLLNYGWTEKDIAVSIGKSEGYIRKLNSLNSAPKKLLNLINSGIVSGTFAMKIIAENKVQEVLDTYNDGEATVSNETEETENVEYFEHEKEDRPAKVSAKITAKSLKPLNSLKEFKKFARNTDRSIIDTNLQPVFDFIQGLLDNEETAYDIKEFFLK